MIRLQFRHNDEIFKSRSEAIQFLDSLLDDTYGDAPLIESKMGEPLVVTYEDEDENFHTILAIGKKDGGTGEKVKYEYIDVFGIYNDIAILSGNVESEILSLYGNVDNAISTLSGNILTELDTQIKSVSGVVENEFNILSGFIENVSENVSTLSGNTIATITLNNKDFIVKDNNANLTLFGNDVTLSGYTISDDPIDAIHDTDTVSLAIGKLEAKSNENKSKIEEEELRATSAEDTISSDLTTLSANTFNSISFLSAETSSVISSFSAGTIGSVHGLSAATYATLIEFSGATLNNLTDLYSALSGETVRAQSVESGITTKIDNEIIRATYKENEIDAKIQTLSGNVETKILIEKGNAIQEAQDYSNAIKDNLSNSIIANKVFSAFGSPILVTPNETGTTLGLSIEQNRVLSVQDGALSTNITLNYDNSGRTIQLLGVNNNILSEIDTSEFVLDGMIESVEVVTSGGTDYLVFKFRTEGGTREIAIATSDLYTQYISGNGITINSANTISIKTNGIGDTTKYLILDERGIGIQNISNDIGTVQSNIDKEIDRATQKETDLTTKIESETSRALQKESEIDSAVSNTKVDLTSEIERAKGAESALTVSVNAEISRATQSENSINSSLSEEKGKISKLQNDLASETNRSIAADESISGATNTALAAIHDWQNTFQESYFVTSEITSITPEQASSQSLLRKISNIEPSKIYASNNAADMIYSGTTNLQAQISGMVQTIIELQTKLQQLESRIGNVEGKNIVGTNQEIKVTDDGETIKIGFADDAIFGPRNSEE